MLYKLHVYYKKCDASWVVLNVNGKLSKITVS